MRKLFAEKPVLGKIVVLVLVLAVLESIAVALGGHWLQLLGAVRPMAVGPMLLAFSFCLVHRVVNAHGWTMVVGALGFPLRTVQGARIWLASEACRWLPGSVWSYGSRGLLATKAGVSPVAAAVSLLWELILTVLAWGVVATVGILFWAGPVPQPIIKVYESIVAHPWSTAFATLAVITVVVGLGSKAVGNRLTRLAAAGRNVGRLQTDGPALFGVLWFYIVMAAFNGLIFWQVVRATPGGERCPLSVVMAANSVAWLIGLFALFAPGGLVVREASISLLLSGWMPPEQAISVALAWRAVQIVAEIAGCLVIAPLGLDRLRPASTAVCVTTEGIDV